MSGTAPHRSLSGGGVDPYGVYNPHLTKPSPATAAPPRPSATGYQSFDHKTAPPVVTEYSSQHQSPHHSPGQQDETEDVAKKSCAAPLPRYVDFCGGPPLLVGPDDPYVKERRYFVGLYMTNEGNVGPWVKKGKGHAGLSFQQQQEHVLLFIISVNAPLELMYSVCVTGALEPTLNGASIEWHDPSLSRKVAVSFQDPALANELYCKIGDVIQVENAISDSPGRMFWHRVSSQQMAVPWNEFATQLVRHARLIRGDLDYIMSALRVSAEEPVVKRDSFVDFLSWFGAFDQAIERMRMLMGQGWFKGFATRQEADIFLKSTAHMGPGAFLLRFSSRPGCFALSYTEYEGQNLVIRHVLISRNPVNDTYVLECADGTSMQFRSLQEVCPTISSYTDHLLGLGIG